MILFASLLIQAAAPMAMSADHAAPCTALVTPPSGWTAVVPVQAVATGEAALPVGKRAHATLLAAAVIRLPVPTTKPPATGSHAGVFAFTVATAGRYRVALGAGVWIDVVAAGKALPAAAHGHGPACSPVRKFVDYDLKPGRYLLQVVGSAAPTLDLRIAPVL